MFKLVYQICLSIIMVVLSACSTTTSFTTNPALGNPQPADAISPHSAFFQENSTVLWYKLQQFSASQLNEMLVQNQEPIARAWIELALLNTRFTNQAYAKQLPQQLLAWQQQYPNHPANALLPNPSILEKLVAQNNPTHLAVLLPEHGKYTIPGRKIRAGILNAYYQHTQSGTAPTIKFYDTTTDNDILQTYQQAVSDGSDFILGPLTKTEVAQLVQSKQITVPTIALNYSDNDALPSNLYEFGLLPEDEVAMGAERAAARGLKRAIIIAPDSDWGKRLSQSFSEKWQSLGGSITTTWYYQAPSTFNEEVAKLLQVDLSIDKQLMREANNKAILQQQRRQDFDVIFLFAQAQAARVIVPLLKYYYANDIPIYATASVYAGKSNVANDSDLNKVLVCDIPQAQVANSNVAAQRLYALGQDAYLLSQSLPTLLALPNFPLYAHTGALMINKQQIHRRLPCRAIHNGSV